MQQALGARIAAEFDQGHGKHSHEEQIAPSAQNFTM
jgi:hypothetical protein